MTEPSPCLLPSLTAIHAAGLSMMLAKASRICSAVRLLPRASRTVPTIAS